MLLTRLTNGWGSLYSPVRAAWAAMLLVGVVVMLVAGACGEDTAPDASDFDPGPLFEAIAENPLEAFRFTSADGQLLMVEGEIAVTIEVAADGGSRLLLAFGADDQALSVELIAIGDTQYLRGVDASGTESPWLASEISADEPMLLDAMMAASLLDLFDAQGAFVLLSDMTDGNDQTLIDTVGVEECGEGRWCFVLTSPVYASAPVLVDSETYLPVALRGQVLDEGFETDVEMRIEWNAEISISAPADARQVSADDFGRALIGFFGPAAGSQPSVADLDASDFDPRRLFEAIANNPLESFRLTSEDGLLGMVEGEIAVTIESAPADQGTRLLMTVGADDQKVSVESIAIGGTQYLRGVDASGTESPWLKTYISISEPTRILKMADSLLDPQLTGSTLYDEVVAGDDQAPIVAIGVEECGEGRRCFVLASPEDLYVQVLVDSETYLPVELRSQALGEGFRSDVETRIEWNAEISISAPASAREVHPGEFERALIDFFGPHSVYR